MPSSLGAENAKSVFVDGSEIDGVFGDNIVPRESSQPSNSACDCSWIRLCPKSSVTRRA